MSPGQQDSDATVNKTWAGGEEFDLRTWQYNDQQSDEYRTVWPDVIAPLAGGSLGQFPAGNAPVVPGSPQIGGAPTVQGSPQAGNAPGAQAPSHMAGHAPPLHELAHQAPSSTPPPQHTWTREHHTSPPHHQQHPPQHHHPHHATPPQQHPPTKKLRGKHRHESAEHQHAQTHRPRRFHLGRTHHAKVATTSKVATGVIAKWAIILLAALVVIASGGIIFVLASTPTLALNGSGTVSAGGTLQLHGRGFVPGGDITLTVDNGLPATLAASRPPQSASREDSAGAANLAGLLNTGQARNTNGSIVVGITGTFDATVIAQSSWPAGRNVLHAKEKNGSRSADLAFTLLAQPAHMAANPATLDFGTIPQGGKVAESVLIGNTGGSSLNWSATTDGSPWLALQSSNGVLQPGAAQDALYALVDTTSLNQGAFTAGIVVHSNGGDTRIAVHLRVGPPVAVKQAQLNVNPSHLDFGQLTPGQQVTNTLTIGNQGTLPLQWLITNSNAGWLSLSLSSGNVQPGGLPQNIQVTIDTNSRSLQTGSNSISITIHSNGGNTVIPVTLTLLAGNTPTPSSSPSSTLSPSPTTIQPPSPTSIPSPSPTLSPSPTTVPSPTPSPTLPPTPTPTPSIQVAPGSLDPTSSACSQNSDGTYTCAVTVSESSQGNLGWFAPTGIGGTNITFSPPNGQFSPSLTSQQVMIASIPCANGSFTFVDQNNNSATVNWSCQPPPSPTPTSPPVSLGSGTWQDSSGGSSYIGDAVTMQLTVQGGTFSGTLTGTTGASTPIQGQDGTLSSFSSNDQQFLNFVMQNYGNQTGIFLAFTNSSDFEGAYAGCKYYGVLEQNGNIEGFWYFPNTSVDAGSIHMNKTS